MLILPYIFHMKLFSLEDPFYTYAMIAEWLVFNPYEYYLVYAGLPI